MSSPLFTDTSAEQILVELRAIRSDVARIGAGLGRSMDPVIATGQVDTAPTAHLASQALPVPMPQPENETQSPPWVRPASTVSPSPEPMARPAPEAKPMPVVPPILQALPSALTPRVPSDRTPSLGAATPYRPVPPPVDEPRRSRLAWFTPERALGLVGSLITLVGIVFALALGVRYAWYGPEARVGSLAVLAAVLAVVAVKVRSRNATGSVALAATSTSAAFLVIVSSTTVFGWVPAVIGLPMALALAIVGFGWAQRWSSQPLAIIILLEVSAAIPVVTRLSTPVVAVLSCLFVLAAVVALTLIASRSGWVIATRVALTTGLLVTPYPLIQAHIGGGLVSPFFIVALVFGLTLAALSVATDEVVLLALSLLVLIILVTSCDERGAALLPGVLVAAAILASRALPGRRGQVLIGFAVVAGFQAVGLGAGAQLRGTAFAACALALALVGRRAKSTVVTVVSWVWALVAVLHIIEPGTAVLWSVQGSMSVSTQLAISAALLSVAAALDMGSGVAVHRVGRVGRVSVALIVASLCAGVTLVSLGIMTAGVPDGFRAGHVLTTIVWVGAGVVLILRGARLRGVGFALAAVSVAKLFLFDLVALEGWLRAVLFLVGGLALLAAAALYRARDLGEPAPAPGPGHRRAVEVRS